MTNHFNEMSKLLASLGRKHNLSTVFNDFLTLGICSYHRTNIQTRLQEVDTANEKLYLQTLKKYDKNEISIFPKILGELQLQVYKHPYSDILGEYFTEHITRGENGQFFTPTPICELLAKLSVEKQTVTHKSILDPACGSARMLLRFAKDNPKNDFYGADVSNTCAKMSTMNFFLNGLRGEVAWMNTLSMQWYGGWHINTNGIGIIPIEKEDSKIWSNPLSPKSDEPEMGQQLTFF
ncbi:N-6 DNA methylase [Kordia periserrulae]|uniref:site-specific DNA-methyltransferase (adenine-specific) n=1 Tax=Kordia periserrulae TaxID=701523 RepID=A0A2T6BR97_9FLAO|nr:N-6 DNA methylase [Kordia periserrulae]PTX58579.1 N-6 DNA methylase [Kordia periserrulae]